MSFKGDMIWQSYELVPQPQTFYGHLELIQSL